MNIRNAWQTCKQLLGLFYIVIRYENRMPLPDNYDNRAKYILPFEGVWTVANGGATQELSHSWDMYTQRFAYDFFIMDENGNTYNGELENPKSYYCYGLNILAPADGTVVHVEERCKDSIIDGKKAHCNSHHLCGNHIVIKHADDEYSFIAHLMNDSITVKIGDLVTQGQYIAKCGNTGNSFEPHLHFHLQNKKSFFTSIGLPIEFTGIAAQSNTNSHLFTPLKTQRDYIEISGKKYIGRGMDVENMMR